MSVTVIPYNPWKEKIAADVLGGLLNRWLDKRDEHERNKGMNEAIANATGTWGSENTEQDTEGLQIPSLQGMAQNPFASKVTASPWESRALSGNSALPQYDANTGALAGLNDLVGMMGTTKNSVSNDVPMSNPTRVGRTANIGSRADFAKMAQTIYANNPTVDPKVLWALLNPMVANQQSWYDKLEQRAREQAAWDAAMGMSDKNLSALELLRNGVPLDQAKFADSVWNPELKYQPIDAGGTIISNTFNPRSGQLQKLGETPVTMTPYQAEQVALGKERNAISRAGLYLRRAAMAARSGGGGGGGLKKGDFYIDVDKRTGHRIGYHIPTGRIVDFGYIPQIGSGSGSKKGELSPDEQYWDSTATGLERQLANSLANGKELNEEQKEQIRQGIATARMNQAQARNRRLGGSQSGGSSSMKPEDKYQLASDLARETGMSFEDAFKAVGLGYEERQYSKQ